VKEEVEHRELSAGGVVIHRDGGPLRYLLIRDSYRNWGFPKGHVENGESVIEAAQREVVEETGLRGVSVLAELGPIGWQFRFGGRLILKTCHFFLMETSDTGTNPQRDEGITECRWATFGEAERLVAYENARGVLRGAHAVAMVAGGRLPASPAGATTDVATADAPTRPTDGRGD